MNIQQYLSKLETRSKKIRETAISSKIEDQQIAELYIESEELREETHNALKNIVKEIVKIKYLCIILFIAVLILILR